MAGENTQIVQKLWNYCNVLRDDGMSYGDYVQAAPAHLCNCSSVDLPYTIHGGRSARAEKGSVSIFLEANRGRDTMVIVNATPTPFLPPLLPRDTIEGQLRQDARNSKQIGSI